MPRVERQAGAADGDVERKFRVGAVRVGLAQHQRGHIARDLVEDVGGGDQDDVRYRGIFRSGHAHHEHGSECGLPRRIAPGGAVNPKRRVHQERVDLLARGGGSGDARAVCGVLREQTIRRSCAKATRQRHREDAAGTHAERRDAGGPIHAGRSRSPQVSLCEADGKHARDHKVVSIATSGRRCGSTPPRTPAPCGTSRMPPHTPAPACRQR
jgi:hypothetical protein